MGALFYPLFIILILIKSLEKLNLSFHIDYVSNRIQKINKILFTINLKFILTITVLVIFLINYINFALVFVKLQELVFDLLRFLQFILRMLLIILLFLIYLKIKIFKNKLLRDQQSKE